MVSPSLVNWSLRHSETNAHVCTVKVCAYESLVDEKVMGSRMLHADIFSFLMNSRPSSSDKSTNRLIHLHNHTLFILIITIFILVMTPLRQGGPYASSSPLPSYARSTDVAGHLSGSENRLFSCQRLSRGAVWNDTSASVMWRVSNENKIFFF